MPNYAADVRYRTTLKWNWTPYNRIVLGARLGVIEAANLYASRLKTIIGVPGFGNSSTPGTPPLLQTGELQNSIQTSFSFLKEVQKARISSRLKKARTLEHGGVHAGHFVAARPAWLPVFVFSYRDMTATIIKRARKNT